MNFGRTGRMAALLVLMAGPAYAQLPALEAEIGAPKVPYCADMFISALDSADVIPGRICRNGNMERREINVGPSGTAMIFDYDAGTIVQLMPQAQAYRRVDTDNGPFRGLIAPTGDRTFKLKKAGRDTVNGMKTTAYNVTTVDNSGQQVDGRVWVTADRIIVKAEGVTTEGGQQVGGGYELANLVTGPHDTSIYKIPANFRELQLDLGNLLLQGQGQGDGAPASVPGLPDPNAMAEIMRKQGVPEAQIEQMLKQMQAIIQRQSGQ